MTVIEISLIIIALSFLVLVIFLCVVCFAAFKTLISFREILCNMHYKMRCLDPLFHSLEIGTEKHRKRLLMRRLVKRDREEEVKLDVATDALALLIQGISLWKKIKRR